MAIYINDNNKIIDIFINPDGQKRKVKSIWCNKNGSATKVFPSEKTPSIKIVTWADGTDEELLAMLDAHYNGEIDIHDYWHIGDERTVQLSAISGSYNDGTSYVSENHPIQAVTFVLMHSGGFKLSSSINDKTHCAFVVGQKNALKVKGQLHKTAYLAYSGISPTHRIVWCEHIYRKSFPSIFVSLFKKIIVYGANGEADKQKMYQNSSFCFMLPSEFNIYGTITNSSSLEKSYQFQFDYYKNSENIRKKLGNDGIYTDYWTSSVSYYEKEYTNGSCVISSNGLSTHYPETALCGISPFGCI